MTATSDFLMDQSHWDNCDCWKHSDILNDTQEKEDNLSYKIFYKPPQNLPWIWASTQPYSSWHKCMEDKMTSPNLTSSYAHVNEGLRGKNEVLIWCSHRKKCYHGLGPIFSHFPLTALPGWSMDGITLGTLYWFWTQIVFKMSLLIFQSKLSSWPIVTSESLDVIFFFCPGNISAIFACFLWPCINA